MSKVALLHERPHPDPLVSRLVHVIQGAGHSVDLPEHTVRFGSSVAKSIIALVRNADVVVVIVSKGSPNIYYELGLLYSLNRPTLLFVNETVTLPSDLSGRLYVSYKDGPSNLSDAFEYKVLQQLNNAIQRTTTLSKQSSVERQILQWSGQFDINNITEVTRLSPRDRGLAFENWFGSLLSEVSGWDIVRRPGGRSADGYDFAVWNNLDDTVLAALGNPIIFELKASHRIGTDQVLKMLYTAKKAGVKGFVLAILGDLSLTTRREILNVYRTERIVPVVLEQIDLLSISAPHDLVDQIRTKAAAILIAGGESV